MVRVIKTEADYRNTLREIDSLITLDPMPGTEEAERLELLTLVVRDYEAKQFPVAKPDPVDALQFRMEQQGLTQRDLIPFLGSRSKVSEILARKRPLTLSMIRALNKGLGIPAEVLLHDQSIEALDEPSINWDRFPIRHMLKRGWVRPGDALDPEAVMREFVAPLGDLSAVPSLYRRTRHFRGGRDIDQYALTAWTLRVVMRGLERRNAARYVPGTVTKKFLKEVVALSWSARGPLLAQEYLELHGIPMVVEPHLPRTHLDGAAILAPNGQPIIGLTIRHDRLDNFWFCLMHELVHVATHLSTEDKGFYDDLDARHRDPREREADMVASEVLVPANEWENSAARNLRTAEAAQALARKLRIHPAIVAGRMRYEWKNFRLLKHLVGHGEVQRLFEDVTWPD